MNKTLKSIWNKNLKSAGRYKNFSNRKLLHLEIGSLHYEMISKKCYLSTLKHKRPPNIEKT